MEAVLIAIVIIAAAVAAFAAVRYRQRSGTVSAAVSDRDDRTGGSQ